MLSTLNVERDHLAKKTSVALVSVLWLLVVLTRYSMVKHAARSGGHGELADGTVWYTAHCIIGKNT